MECSREPVLRGEPVLEAEDSTSRKSGERGRYGTVRVGTSRNVAAAVYVENCTRMRISRLEPFTTHASIIDRFDGETEAAYLCPELRRAEYASGATCQLERIAPALASNECPDVPVCKSQAPGGAHCTTNFILVEE